MKCWSIVASAVVIITPAAAWAEDDWTGFYAGVETGATSGRIEASGTDPVNQLTNVFAGPSNGPPLVVVPSTTKSYAGNDSDLGLLYGGFVGGQLQTGSWLLGIEGDFEGGRDAGSFAVTSTLPASALSAAGTVIQGRSARIRYSWSARGRIGIVSSATLLYATAGFAQAGISLQGTNSFSTPPGPGGVSYSFVSPGFGPVVITSSRRATMNGWAAGLGAEQRVSSRFTLGLDARYADYGSKTVALCSGALAIRTGGCPGDAFSSPALVINGVNRTADPTQSFPSADFGPTQVGLSEWRVALRAAFRF